MTIRAACCCLQNIKNSNNNKKTWFQSVSVPASSTKHIKTTCTHLLNRILLIERKIFGRQQCKQYSHDTSFPTPKPHTNHWSQNCAALTFWLSPSFNRWPLQSSLLYCGGKDTHIYKLDWTIYKEEGPLIWKGLLLVLWGSGTDLSLVFRPQHKSFRHLLKNSCTLGSKKQ